MHPICQQTLLTNFTNSELERYGMDMEGRLLRIAEQVLSLDAIELTKRQQRVKSNLTDRHRDVERLLQRRFHEMTDPATDRSSIRPEQALLIGAYFTEE